MTPATPPTGTSATTTATATATAPATAPPGSTSRRAVRGWLLYDVGNSAFVTAVVTALGGPFLTGLATAAAGGDGRLDIGGFHPRAASLYAYVTSLSVLVQVVLLPLLGAAADRPAAKRRLLVGATGVGVLATVALAAAPAGGWLFAAAALLVANAAFGAAIVAYNATLADVAAPAERDRVSSRGFAAGYLGGASHLAIVLGALLLAPRMGIGTGTVVRGALLSAALWWAAFSVLAVRRMGRPAATVAAPRSAGVRTAVRDSVRDLRGAARELRRLPGTARYLAAFLLFNDAIQAVVALSSVFIAQELYVANGRPAEDATTFLLVLVLLIQAVAVVGALAFGRLAGRVGAKRALMTALVGWIGVVAYSFAALRTHGDAIAAGVVIALVLGGSQALARSLFSRMVPDGRQAAFFGFYELAERGTAWIGTLVFAVVLDVTGSYRLGLLSLVVLLGAGTALLAATDTDAAVAAAQGTPRPAARSRGDRTFRCALAGLRQVVRLCTRTRRVGLANVPAAGPVIVAGNHLSVADGFVLVDAVARAGRLPRVMGTAGLFSAPVVGRVLTSFGAIPVHRRSSTPASALAPAQAALDAGECVALYPEGAITRLDGGWPARARTGVVRLALDTGAPVVPLAQWGTDGVVGAEGTRHRALLLPLRRPRVSVLVGPPIDLRAALGLTSAADATAEQLREGADLVMAALVVQVATLRGEPAPPWAGCVDNPPASVGRRVDGGDGGDAPDGGADPAIEAVSGALAATPPGR